jgi:hypothetical protein
VTAVSHENSFVERSVEAEKRVSNEVVEKSDVINLPTQEI